MSNKSHLKFICNKHNFSYTSKKAPPKINIPIRDYRKHANNLLIEFSDAEMQYNERKYEILSKKDYIEDLGIYLTLSSATNYTLPLESLDTRDIKLSQVYSNNNNEEAIIFIPEQKREIFLKKISDYMISINNNNKKNPDNKSLINSIESIRLTNLRDFWTDNINLFPENKDSVIWWEVWVKKINDNPEHTFNAVKKLKNVIQCELGETYLNFFESIVFLIKASVRELEKSLFLMTNLLEIRHVPETPNFFVNLNSSEQLEWTNDLSKRLIVNDRPTTSVCILDTGVNYHHPLLKKLCSDNYSISYNPNWVKYDVKPSAYERKPYSPHGSMQAGIIGFGSLQKCLEHNNPVYISHIIESGRILPPSGFNKPELYGAITTETSYKVEISNTNIKNRIFSMAVSANSENTGAPSSWSSEIDRFTFGELSESYKRLFVIATGNNMNLDPNIDLWDQAHLAKIEDPAQSWNSLTVGSMTNLITITDLLYEKWKPWSESGDISPSTRTSVNWEWRKQAPIKPDFVLEGGNRLLSPSQPYDVTNHDDVSILTTSGDISLPFDSHLDSSSACALASHFSALIADKYPTFWPETVRGLLIHSCKFNHKINEAYQRLKN